MNFKLKKLRLYQNINALKPLCLAGSKIKVGKLYLSNFQALMKMKVYYLTRQLVQPATAGTPHGLKEKYGECMHCMYDVRGTSSIQVGHSN